MQYKQIQEEQQTLDIADDDGELDIIVKKQPKKQQKISSFLLFVILVTCLGALLIYFGMQETVRSKIKTESKDTTHNYTQINKTVIPTKYINKSKESDDGPKLEEVHKQTEQTNQQQQQDQESEETIMSEEEQIVNNDINNENQNNNQEQNDYSDTIDALDKNSEEEIKAEEETLNFEEMEKQSQKLKKDIEDYYRQKNQTQLSEDKRYDKQLCEEGYYMNGEDKFCTKCDERCSSCMHISGTCFKCEQEYFLNIYGKCVSKCEGNHDSNNLLLSDENKNERIQFCLGKNYTSSIYMTVQKSNNTHFVLPYIIIHPATTVSLLYRNSYPLVYYFNKDLFNFEDNVKLSEIIFEAQEKQLIVVVMGCHTLYDFSLFNNFLFQEAIQNIEGIVRAKGKTFRAYFGQDYNAYGVIREYQAQYKNNSIDLVISDDPIEIKHEQLEKNLLVTHEQHYTDYKFESLQGAQSDKTTVILLFHTKNESDTNDYCSKFTYVSFLQCAVREIQIDHLQRIKQGFELITQFVVQPDL